MKKILLVFILLLITGCSVEQDSEKNIVNIGLMIHVESWRSEVFEENTFEKHSQAVEEMATILEQYGAIGTFEFSPEFIEAANNWDSDIIQELHDRGHGIGVHADAGVYNTEDRDYNYFVKDIKNMRMNLENLVDFPILHVSGICSEMDWVSAALDAGYKFTTGAVGFCAMSMTENLRPESYKNCESPSSCHGAIPIELIDSLKPIYANSGDDWLYSEEGELVILNARNTLYAQYEERYGVTSGGFGNLDSNDLLVTYEDIDVAIENNEGGLIYYAWSIGDIDLQDSVIFKEWLETLDEEYISKGKVKWISLLDAYMGVK